MLYSHRIRNQIISLRENSFIGEELIKQRIEMKTEEETNVLLRSYGKILSFFKIII